MGISRLYQIYIEIESTLVAAKKLDSGGLEVTNLGMSSAANKQRTGGGEPPMLSVRKITKLFGDFAANKEIDLDIGSGEIHALLGENGAGKSTLVKMLYGSLQPTGGEIIWKGKPVTIPNPSAARGLGVGMVFQHFSLFDSLSVADNIALSLRGADPITNLSEKARELSKKYGLPLNPDSMVGDLSVGERQRVEIVRCLLQNPDLVILDEPTSVLTPQEAENLFQTLERLKEEGRSILYISHRLEEVKRLCDQATILRFGEVTGDCDPNKETAASLARMMVGSDISEIKKNATVETDNLLLTLDNFNLEAASPFAIPLTNINLKVRQGEIIGIAGVAGNGQSELFDAMSGERTVADNNCVTLRSQPVGKLGINARRKLGAAFVPEERLGHGAVSDFRLSDNLLLARHDSDRVAFLRFGKIGFIWREMVEKATTRIIEEMDVRKSGDDPEASSLSGGNLQKFIIGRELDRQPSVLVVNQPSWGVDAGAAARIRQAIIDLARSGSSVVVISQDLDEIFEVADRIAVMSEGHLSSPEDIASTNREKIGLLMAGVGIGESDGAAARSEHAA